MQKSGGALIVGLLCVLWVGIGAPVGAGALSSSERSAVVSSIGSERSADFHGFTLRALPGSPRRSGVLSRYRGQRLALLFYEDQCTYCLRTLRSLAAVAPGFGTQVLGVGVGQSGAALAEWGERAGVDVALVQANGPLLAAVGGVRATPVVVLIDPEGRQVAVEVGELDAAAVRAFVESAWRP